MTLSEIAGREIRALRQRRFCTLAHVAHVTGLSASYLSEVERGLVNLPLATLERLAAAFEVSPLRLLGLDADEQGRRLRAEGRLARIAGIAQGHDEAEGAAR